MLAPPLGTLAHPLAGSSTRNTTQLRSQVCEQFWTLRYRGLSATPPPVSSGTLTHPHRSSPSADRCQVVPMCWISPLKYRDNLAKVVQLKPAQFLNRWDISSMVYAVTKGPHVGDCFLSHGRS